MPTYCVRQSSNYDFKVINKFETLEKEFVDEKRLAERKSKRKSKISVQNKFHTKRWCK